MRISPAPTHAASRAKKARMPPHRPRSFSVAAFRHLHEQRGRRFGSLGPIAAVSIRCVPRDDGLATAKLALAPPATRRRRIEPEVALVSHIEVHELRSGIGVESDPD